ncbi:MAG: type II toxin-antitoxin system RelE/ParE family toxin [Rickettsiales bacterium]|nr:type II toxin-antitoxin system RelE/ParE family toxin [Rickettsiales bacterium]
MKVVFYKKDSGREPIKEDICKLENDDKAEIVACLKDIEDVGFNSNRVQFRKIDGKLWEIKIETKNCGYRIFYVVIDGDIILLLHFYKKQSQKAPRKEIEVAMKRMKDVINKNMR